MRTVVWKGYYNGYSGITKATRRLPIAINNIGIDCKISPLKPLDKNDPLEELVVKKTPENALTILHQIPTIAKGVNGYYAVTEFEQCPTEWWTPLLEAEVIMTQSRFCKKVFSKIPGMDKNKIYIVHLPCDEDLSPEGSHLKYKIKNIKTGQYLATYDFLFGSMFEWVARKVPHLMWRAFQEEFPYKQYPNVGFINKMSIPLGGQPHGFRDWKRYLPKDPRIMVCTDKFDDIGEFYRSLDCYASPTAGEGWGATLSEAMQCGIPTIGSNHSGNLDFMNDKNSYLVDVHDWSLIGNNKINHLPMVYPWQRWKLPKVDSIKKAMREVYEIKMSGELNPKATEALKIKERFNMNTIAQQLKRALIKYI